MLRSTKVRNRDAYQLTFTLPPEAPPGPVSVVGDFNDWTPGRHQLKQHRDGSRSVTVRVPAAKTVRFRYLAADGYWFDEPAVAERDGVDCVIHT
jgi:hypothetical protein